MAENPYAAGKKVYNGGSSAAHSGRDLDPMGYVIRERLRTFTPHQPSQRRSGQAAAMLRRGGVPSNQQVNNSTGQQQAANQARAQADKQAPKPQQLISPTGQLNLPWNMQNMLMAIQAQQQYQNTIQQNTAARQDYNQQYNQQLRQGAIDQNQIQDQTLNNAAGRGMAFSSGYGNQVATNAQNYNDWQAQMEGQKASFLSGIRNSNTEAQNQLLGLLRQMAISQGIDLEKYAGQLGLSTAKNKKEKPTVKRPHHKHHNKPHHGGRK